MALPEPSSKNEPEAKVADQDDKDFDPTPEALIDEIDDERTLEEEEALDVNNGPTVQEELDELKKESEMPIEELLAYYERLRNESQEEQNSDHSDEDEDEEEEEDEEDDDEETESKQDNEAVKRGKDGDRDDKDGQGRSSEAPSAPEPFSDATSKQDDTKNSEAKQVQSSDPPPSSQVPTEQQKSLDSCDMVDFQVHTTTPNPAEKQTKASPDLQTGRTESTEISRPADNPSDNQSSVVASSAPARHRHSLTNFMIDDDLMFKALLSYDLDSDDMDDDYSYTDEENGDDERDWRRVIHIGTDHQAEVPEGLSEYDDLPPYENDDKLVWGCSPSLTQEQILDYLKKASLLSKRSDISTSPASVPKIPNECSHRERMQDITTIKTAHSIEHNHENIINRQPPENVTDVYMSQSRKRARIDYELEQENTLDGVNQATSMPQNQVKSCSREENSDSASQDVRSEVSTEEYFQAEEQLLFLLLQCNHNIDEALRRRRIDPFKYYLHEPMTLWSQEECLNFELGLRTFGKDFRSIRDNHVQTRTYAEVVSFYYLWKKSERHDVYTNRYKLDRKRCLSHPGTTDYMDKFIDDNESSLNTSASPPPPTAVESDVGASSDANRNNMTIISTMNSCHSSDVRLNTIHNISRSQGPTLQRHHIQLHQPQIDNERVEAESICADTNSAL